MEHLKTVVVSVIAASIVAVGFVLLLPKNSNGTPSLGALAGPDIISPYLRWGGVATYAARVDTMNTASTTACSIQSPAATSTLELGSGANFTVSSTTATAVRVYKASYPATATTFLFGANIAANAQGAVVATTSTDDFVFAPSTWVNIVLSGGTGTFSPTGACQAKFVSF